MSFEKDFILDEVKEFEIDGRKFKYKVVTSDDELDWLPYYLEKNKKGKIIQNLKKRAKCKFANLVEVPWSDETLKKVSKKVLGKKKTWKDMNKDERRDIIGKLSPRLYDKIVSKMDEIDEESSPIKKN